MRRYTPHSLAAFFLVLVLVVLRNDIPSWFSSPVPYTATIKPGGQSDQKEILFCHWNVENLFDDEDNGRTGPGDRDYDPLFAHDPELLRLKLSKLTEAILKMNDGRGPDILALVEVESVRAAELLQKSLNDRLPAGVAPYKNLLMKEIAGGRHIAPAILTRLPAVKDRTRTHGNRLRILEGHIVVNDHDLTIFASHWSSRLKESGESGRESYADKIYGACNAICHSNPAADILVSGDFNDDPDDVSVTQHLHAGGDRPAIGATTLQLFNLMAGKNATVFGTHFYKKWHIFDQVVVSPGLLDSKGWTCDPNSVRVVNTLHRPSDRQARPWRFGGAKEKGERGYSDHFPVTVRLQVE